MPRTDLDQIHLPDPVLNDIRELQNRNIQLHKELKEMEKICDAENIKIRRKRMKVYNTLTRRKEEFIPLEEGKVKVWFVVYSI